MNSEICFDACRNTYGKSSSTFWGIFIEIPKLIPRVATLNGYLSVKQQRAWLPLLFFLEMWVL